MALDDGLSPLAATDPGEKLLLAMISEGETMRILEFIQK